MLKMYETETLFPEIQPNTRSRCYWGLDLTGERAKCGITTRLVARRGGEVGFNELCSVPGGRSIEEEFHRKYAKERIGNSEWFRLSDRLAFDLLIMCTQQGRVKSVETLKAIMLARIRKRGGGDWDLAA
jgi:Meiotically Up-regulated Gene 113 (MUG113) protein